MNFILSILAAIFSPLFEEEISHWLRKLNAKLIRMSAALVSDSELRERLTEEWASHAEELPPLSGFFHALGCFRIAATLLARNSTPEDLEASLRTRIRYVVRMQWSFTLIALVLMLGSTAGVLLGHAPWTWPALAAVLGLVASYYGGHARGTARRLREISQQLQMAYRPLLGSRKNVNSDRARL